MIRVSKDEMRFLKEHDPTLEYARTCVQDSSRNAPYYVAEKRLTLAALQEYWNNRITEHFE